MSHTSAQLNDIHQQALAFHQAGQLEQAEVLYRQLVEQDPDEPMIYIQLSSVLLGQGKGPAALQILEQGRCRQPENVETLSALGSLIANQGDIAQGRALLEQAVRINPASAVAHYSLAGVLYQGGMIEQALEACQAGIELSPCSAEGHLLLGNILTTAELPAQAIEAFRDCIRFAPQWLPAYMSVGRLLTEAGRYEEALHYYQQAQALQPDYVEIYKNLGMLLHVTGQLDEAETQLRKALEKNQADAESYMLLANVLRDLGRLNEAGEFYQLALKHDPSLTAATENLQRIANSRIPQWHFDMLADSARNEAFDQALSKAVSDRVTVLDIGTGSGLLAMMAARAGAKQVIACEMVPDLARVAQHIVQQNGLQNRIHMINKKSTSLKVGEHLTEPADLLVAEILDAGLLGEGVLPTLRHAKANLIKPNATIIPRAADVCGMLIESSSLDRFSPIGTVAGFDLNAFNALREVDTYRTVDLSSTEHRQLTDNFAIHSVDFYNLPPAVSDNAPRTWEIQINATSAGTVQGIAFWFVLYMDDETRVSSGPDGEMVHWGQAVQLFPEALSVREGQELKVRVEQRETQYDFHLLAD